MICIIAASTTIAKKLDAYLQITSRMTKPKLRVIPEQQHVQSQMFVKLITY